jgi:hypothetical protein
LASLHADRKYNNTRQRIHFILELPWSEDKAVQQSGLSPRRNQCTAPVRKIVMIDSASEKRFARAIA